jgi:hypothetical protein
MEPATETETVTVTVENNESSQGGNSELENVEKQERDGWRGAMEALEIKHRAEMDAMTARFSEASMTIQTTLEMQVVKISELETKISELETENTELITELEEIETVTQEVVNDLPPVSEETNSEELSGKTDSPETKEAEKSQAQEAEINPKPKTETSDPASEESQEEQQPDSQAQAGRKKRRLII